MSEIAGERRGAKARRGLPSWTVLLCGALATGVCLLLLFGPFYPYAGTPGQLLQYRLLMLLDGTGPRILSDLLWNRFFLTTTIVLGVILMLLPWRGARKRQRGGTAGAPGEQRNRTEPRGDAGAARFSITERTISLTFSDDGRVLDPEDPGAEKIERSISDLRMMARAARVPWRSDYETSGGARAFLEVLRSLNTGPVGVHRAEDVRGEAFVPEAGADPADPVDPVDPVSPVSPTDRVDPTDLTDPAEPAVPPAGGDADLPSGAGVPTSTGSVYTPTTLYRSSTWDRDPEEDEQR